MQNFIPIWKMQNFIPIYQLWGQRSLIFTVTLLVTNLLKSQSAAVLSIVLSYSDKNGTDHVGVEN